MPNFQEEGFESNSLSRYATIGSPAIVTTPVRTGKYALELSPAGADEGVGLNLPSGTQYVAQSFYAYWPTLPTSTDRVIMRIFGTGQSFVQFHPASNQFGVRIGGVNVIGGPTIVARRWYLLDVEADYRANPNSIKLKVDGGTEISRTNAVAASDITQIRFGDANGVTHTIYHDDWGVSLTPGDYPIGPHAYSGAPVMRVGAGRREGI